MATFGKRVRDLAARARYAVDTVDEFGAAFEAGQSRDIRIEVGRLPVFGGDRPAAAGPAPGLPGRMDSRALLVFGAIVLALAWR